MADAGAEAVAEKVANQARLTINNLQRPFRAIGNTQTATIAFYFIDLNDFSFTHLTPLIKEEILTGFNCAVIYFSIWPIFFFKAQLRALTQGIRLKKHSFKLNGP
jgi:hypothetical protein